MGFLFMLQDPCRAEGGEHKCVWSDQNLDVHSDGKRINESKWKAELVER